MANSFSIEDNDIMPLFTNYIFAMINDTTNRLYKRKGFVKNDS